MSRAAMRAVLFWLFVLVVGVTTFLTAYGTLTAIKAPDSKELWEFEYFTWRGFLLEVAVFVIALATNLFGLRSYDLAREVAGRLAQELVSGSGGDPAALNTEYWVAREDFQVHFRSQGRKWLRVLEKEFEAETTRESRRYPTLKKWKPSAQSPDLAPVELGRG